MTRLFGWESRDGVEKIQGNGACEMIVSLRGRVWNIWIIWKIFFWGVWGGRNNEGLGTVEHWPRPFPSCFARSQCIAYPRNEEREWRPLRKEWGASFQREERRCNVSFCVCVSDAVQGKFRLCVCVDLKVFRQGKSLEQDPPSSVILLSDTKWLPVQGVPFRILHCDPILNKQIGRIQWLINL